jgi:hypothetical protein
MIIITMMKNGCVTQPSHREPPVGVKADEGDTANPFGVWVRNTFVE